MADLNTLIPPNPGVVLWEAAFVSDSGEIAALGTLSNGDIHSFVLTPCNENHPGVEGCDYSMVEEPARSSAPRNITGGTHREPQSQRTRWYHLPSLRQPSR